MTQRLRGYECYNCGKKIRVKYSKINKNKEVKCSYCNKIQDMKLLEEKQFIQEI